MSGIEEITEKYNKRRTTLNLLRYIELIWLILMFYSLIRHAFANPGITQFFIVVTFIVVMIKQGYIFSIYGIGPRIKDSKLPKLNLKIIIAVVLIAISLIEFSLLLIS